MTRVLLEIVTMSGSDYVLWDRAGHRFPHGELHEGESPGDAARRMVLDWTGTKLPKLEIIDILHAADTLTLVFRALLTEEPQGAPKRVMRMELPKSVGALEGKYVEEALKTSLNYKLTRG